MAGSAEQVVTCSKCSLKYFASTASTCPRCARGATPSQAPPAAVSPTDGASGRLTPQRREEARQRLLVWKDPKEIVIDRLVGQGVPEDEVRAFVAEQARAVHQQLAPEVRFRALVHLAVAVVIGAVGAFFLWVTSEGAGMRRGPWLTLAAGGVATLVALALGARSIFWLLTGKASEED